MQNFNCTNKEILPLTVLKYSPVQVSITRATPTSGVSGRKKMLGQKGDSVLPRAHRRPEEEEEESPPRLTSPTQWVLMQPGILGQQGI